MLHPIEPPPSPALPHKGGGSRPSAWRRCASISAESALGNFFKAAKNRRAYVAWMEDTIRANMETGQKGLVVCKKTLFENEDVPENATEVANWDIDGRQLYTTHWGTGIGSNTWRDAEVVFLFDEFFVPRRVMIASAQGLQNHRATEGDLSKMKTLNSKAPAVDLLEQGHLLRWQKQMPLRGHGRCFDEHGNCGEQKLVYVGDRKRLLAHANTLYPGAKIVSQPGNSRPKTKADALLD